MNCKPGDFAVIVKALLPNDQQYLGVFLTVTKICIHSRHMHGGTEVIYWEFKDASMPLFCPGGTPAECVRDECLQPIRPPLLELPAPPVPEELTV